MPVVVLKPNCNSRGPKATELKLGGKVPAPEGQVSSERREASHKVHLKLRVDHRGSQLHLLLCKVERAVGGIVHGTTGCEGVVLHQQSVRINNRYEM